MEANRARGWTAGTAPSWVEADVFGFIRAAAPKLMRHDGPSWAEFVQVLELSTDTVVARALLQRSQAHLYPVDAPHSVRGHMSKALLLLANTHSLWVLRHQWVRAVALAWIQPSVDMRHCLALATKFGKEDDVRDRILTVCTAVLSAYEHQPTKLRRAVFDTLTRLALVRDGHEGLPVGDCTLELLRPCVERLPRCLTLETSPVAAKAMVEFLMTMTSFHPAGHVHTCMQVLNVLERKWSPAWGHHVLRPVLKIMVELYGAVCSVTQDTLRAQDALVRTMRLHTLYVQSSGKHLSCLAKVLLRLVPERVGKRLPCADVQQLMRNWLEVSWLPLDTRIVMYLVTRVCSLPLLKHIAAAAKSSAHSKLIQRQMHRISRCWGHRRSAWLGLVMRDEGGGPH